MERLVNKGEEYALHLELASCLVKTAFVCVCWYANWAILMNGYV